MNIPLVNGWSAKSSNRKESAADNFIALIFAVGVVIVLLL